MRALTYGGETNVKVVDVPMPSINNPTDALVRVTLSAVCAVSYTHLTLPTICSV